MKLENLQNEILRQCYIKIRNRDLKIYLPCENERGEFFVSFNVELEASRDLKTSLSCIFNSIKRYHGQNGQNGQTGQNRAKKGDFLICGLISMILGDRGTAGDYFDKLSKWYREEGKVELADKCCVKARKLKLKQNQNRYEFEMQIQEILKESPSPSDEGPMCYLCYGHNVRARSSSINSIQNWIWDIFLPDLELTRSTTFFDKREESNSSSMNFLEEMDKCRYILMVWSSDLFKYGETPEITKAKSHPEKVLLLIYEETSEIPPFLQDLYKTALSFDFTKDYFEGFLSFCVKLRGNPLAPKFYIDGFKKAINKTYTLDYANKINTWIAAKEGEKEGYRNIFYFVILIPKIPLK